MSKADAALLAIEERVRSQIAAQVTPIADNFGAYYSAVLKEHPDLTATEILSRQDVHETLTTVLNAAETKTEDTTSAGYKAAAALALVAVAAQLRDEGHESPRELPDLGDYLTAVLRGVKLAFAAALIDIHNSIRPAHDGVSSDDQHQRSAARVLTTNAALRRAIRRLNRKAVAAGTFAVHRGYTDAQLALYRHFQQINPYVVLHKKWQVTAHDPCPTCLALDGATAALDAEFDHGSVLPVHRDLLGPPRHPNCRCRIVLEFKSSHP